MIRNEVERSNAEKQLQYLRSEREQRLGDEGDVVAQGVASALDMQISDIENEIAEYNKLKEGRAPLLKARTLDDLGELLIKARIARGWSQADMAGQLEMKHQQIQRYESEDWQRASLWRLQEAADALGLNVAVKAVLDNGEETEGNTLVDDPTTAIEMGDIVAKFIGTRVKRFPGEGIKIARATGESSRSKVYQVVKDMNRGTRVTVKKGKKKTTRMVTSTSGSGLNEKTAGEMVRRGRIMRYRRTV